MAIYCQWKYLTLLHMHPPQEFSSVGAPLRNPTFGYLIVQLARRKKLMAGSYFWSVPSVSSWCTLSHHFWHPTHLSNKRAPTPWTQKLGFSFCDVVCPICLKYIHFVVYQRLKLWHINSINIVQFYEYTKELFSCWNINSRSGVGSNVANSVWKFLLSILTQH